MSRQEKGPIETSGKDINKVVGSLKNRIEDRSVWMPIAILLMLLVLIFVTVWTFALRARLADAESTIALLSEQVQSLQPGWIDSEFSDVQPIGEGFSVVDFKAEPVDGGVRVTGSVINGGSLDHYNAAFRVIFDDNREAQCLILTLRAGHSAPFDVIVGPAGEKSVPKSIRIRFAGSEVSYY